MSVLLIQYTGLHKIWSFYKVYISLLVIPHELMQLFGYGPIEPFKQRRELPITH